MGKQDKARVVHDNIHGLIRLTQEEVDVIDHPVFQRLRRICQTGLLRYVWPSATHTRFEHSLGVVHVAQKELDALMLGSTSGMKKLYPLMEAMRGHAVRFHELPDETRAQLERIVRLTALVHDLGHGPLSHVFDVFAPKIAEIASILDDPRLAELAAFRELLLGDKNGRVRHEAMSCILFAKIWHDLGGEPWIVQAVAAALLGKPPWTRIRPDLIPLLPLIRDIVSSAPIDADRMDYLLRDSRALGVSYGLHEPDRILKSILCVATDEGFRLGWRHSGLRAIESFVTSRFHMFAQCYTHKTVRAYELMLDAIRTEAAELDARIIPTENLDRLTGAYEGLGDEAFLATLEHGFGRTAERLATLVQDLRARRLWKRLYDFERDETHLCDRLVEEMQRRHPEDRFIIDKLPLKAMKDLDRGSFLLRLNAEGRYSMTENRSWIEASPIMRVLRDEERSRLRLFVEAHEGRRSAKALRDEAVALACALRDAAPLP